MANIISEKFNGIKNYFTASNEELPKLDGTPLEKMYLYVPLDLNNAAYRKFEKHDLFDIAPQVSMITALMGLWHNKFAEKMIKKDLFKSHLTEMNKGMIWQKRMQELISWGLMPATLLPMAAPKIGDFFFGSSDRSPFSLTKFLMPGSMIGREEMRGQFVKISSQVPQMVQGLASTVQAEAQPTTSIHGSLMQTEQQATEAAGHAGSEVTADQRSRAEEASKALQTHQQVWNEISKLGS